MKKRETNHPHFIVELLVTWTPTKYSAFSRCLANREDFVNLEFDHESIYFVEFGIRGSYDKLVRVAPSPHLENSTPFLNPPHFISPQLFNP